MATQPTAAAPPPGSARELVKAMRERNAPAALRSSVASPRCAGSPSSCAPPAGSGTRLKGSIAGARDGDGVRVVLGPVRQAWHGAFRGRQVLPCGSLRES